MSYLFLIAKANSYFTLFLETELLEEILELMPTVSISNANLWFIWQFRVFCNCVVPAKS